ncbi:MAG: PAS domain S-box protein [Arcobacteraceae bacterium]|nr:PAS domain S-box protein [Arcobacteraceae bacterium]
MSKLYFNTKLLGLFTILGVITSSFTFYLFSNFNKDNYIELIVIVFIGSTLVSLFLSYIFSNYNKKSQESLNNKLALKTKELEKSLFLVDKYIIRTTTDTRGVITSANEAFCDISGYTEEELIGKPHSIIRDPDMPKEAFKDLWDTIQSGKSWSGEVKNRKKDGSSYWVFAYIEPIFDDKHIIIGYSAIRQEITDKKDAQFKMEQIDAIIKFANSGVGTIDFEGNFLSVNGYYTKLFGYSTEEMIGKNCIEMSSSDSKIVAEEALKTAIETGTVSQVEKACDDKYGNKVHVEFSLNLLPDKKTFVVVINSLEDKKKLEALNKSLNEKIKQEVEKSTKQLEMIQKEQLESAKLSSIGALAAGITHEINTPLTYIKGNFELMNYDIDDLEPSDIKTRMKNDSIKIIEGIDRIANIIESMKEVSQVASEKKDLVNIYSTLVTALIVSHNSINQITNVYLNGEKFDINTDKNKFIFNSKVQKQRIEQVWIVIIKNALDQLIYIDDFDNRKLSIDINNIENHVVVQFKDNGGGIKKDILENIFEPFVSFKEHGGIGVGLNIAKKIIEDQDGEISAYNEDNGAVFEVKLKLY